MRLYDLAVTTLAIGAPRKWTDNVLSHHAIPGVLRARQGVARRLPYESVIRLALIRQLHADLGVGVRDAVRIAERFLDSGQPRVLEIGELRLTLDVDALRRKLDERLALALESAPSPRRGRPSRKRPA